MGVSLSVTIHVIIHEKIVGIPEVTFSMAAALGMKDLTADYHLFQAGAARCRDGT